MLLSPTGTSLVGRRFEPQGPTALNYRIWREVSAVALEYWTRLGEEGLVSEGFRRIVEECRSTLARVIDERG
jgi:hypothetical protein